MSCSAPTARARTSKSNVSSAVFRVTTTGGRRQPSRGWQRRSPTAVVRTTDGKWYAVETTAPFECRGESASIPNPPRMPRAATHASSKSTAFLRCPASPPPKPPRRARQPSSAYRKPTFDRTRRLPDVRPGSSTSSDDRRRTRQVADMRRWAERSISKKESHLPSGSICRSSTEIARPKLCFTRRSVARLGFRPSVDRRIYEGHSSALREVGHHTVLGLVARPSEEEPTEQSGR